jgi:uncharacterized protein YegJ (DUF2314 family)
MIRFHRLVLISAMLACLGHAQAETKTESKPKPAKKVDDRIVEIKAEDPAMQAAFKKAQASLDQFLAVVATKNPKLDNISVKIAVKDHKRVEYFWITPFTVEADGFSGAINNIPRFVTNVQLGQTRKFARADIVDWMYTETVDKAMTMHGNFTTCAMLTKESPDDAKELKRRYGLDCSH